MCVQNMVFGNSVFRSGTGVCTSRHPITGEKALFGEYAMNAEGEDVFSVEKKTFTMTQLAQLEPQIYRDLDTVATTLEKHYRDMQDVEFAVDGGNLFVLQSRRAQRSAKASVKVAVDMVEEGLLTERQALLRIDADMLDDFSYEVQDATTTMDTSILLGNGKPISRGVAIGKLCFTREECEKVIEAGESAVLCLHEARARDIGTIKLCAGVLLMSGTESSESAVLCRGLGKVCVLAGEDLRLEGDVTFGLQLRVCQCNIVNSGEVVSLDGNRYYAPTLRPVICFGTDLY